MNFNFCLLVRHRFKKKEWVLIIPNPENDSVIEMGCRIKPLQTEETKNNFCLLADCFYNFFFNKACVNTNEFFKGLNLILSFKRFIFFH